jgi:hypothetical protein
MMLKRRTLMGVTMTMAVVFCVGISFAGQMKQNENMDMKMHHLHMLMNHGLGMVSEGASLEMLAGMKMTPAVDPMMLKHGKTMISQGKSLISRALDGPEMKAMMKGKDADSPHMKYTHELGENMLVAADILEKMSVEGMSAPDMMAMHHQHIMLNHALGMAAEGANLVMLGQMGMAGDVDDFSIEHGKMMLKDAQSMVSEIMEDKAMKEMHERGISPEKDPMMKETHKLAEVSLKIIDMLSKMPVHGMK